MPGRGVCEVCKPSHRPGPVIRARCSRCCSLALGVVAALAAVGAYLATHVSDDSGRHTRAAKPRHSGDLMTAASQGSNS